VGASNTRRVDGPTRKHLMKLRDEFVALATRGRFNDAASREWAALPLELRLVLLMLAGVGEVQVSPALQALAVRAWNEVPPTEREAVRAVVRRGVPPLARLRALAARV